MTNAHRLISGRLLRFTGNMVKAFSYVFHYILPHKRFRIPCHAGPVRQRDHDGSGIPRVLWQTNYTDSVTLPVYMNYLVNRLMGRDFVYRFMSTEDRLDYISEHFPAEILNCYCRLQIGAAQADLWRMLVLHREGGVYMDIDGHAVWPLRAIIKGHQRLFVLTRKGQLSNYFLAAQPNDPVIAQIIETIVDNIQQDKDLGVFDMTGPGAMRKTTTSLETPSILGKAACIQGSFTNEHFQYIDKKEGKWTRQQKTTRVIDR